MKIIDVLNGNNVSPPPIWLMRQAGRYLKDYREVRKQVSGFLDLCYTPQKAYDVTMQPIDLFGFDAAILFSDILVIPHALGVDVDFIEGKGPILSPFNAENLPEMRDIDIHDRLNPVYHAVSMIRQGLDKNKALFGFAGAPWTIASYMIEGGGSKDYRKLHSYSRLKTREFEQLLELIALKTADYLMMQIEYGADALMLFDSWAGVIADDVFDDFCIAPNKIIIDRINEKYPHIPLISFPKAIGARLPKFIEKTGCKAISLDHTQSLDFITANISKDIVIQGNLDPFLLYAGGQNMRDQIDVIINKLSDYPLIFNLGHGVDRATNPQHVHDLINHIRQ